MIMINEAIIAMNRVHHSFRSKEKEFVLEFAFKSADTELTNKLIDELVLSKDEKEADEVIQKYAALLDNDKPEWVTQAENLLVALEKYRIEEERAIMCLSDILGAYGIDVSVDEMKDKGTEEIKRIVKKEAQI